MFFKNRRVLVTGGCGLVGSHLVKRLVSEGAIVKATFHNNHKFDLNLPVNYISANLTDPRDCDFACRNQDYVFLCAASTAGASVMTNSPLAHVTPNIIMNCQTLESAYNNGVRKVLYLSSSTVYPDKKDDTVYESEAFVDDPFDKYYPVGWMKRYSEVLCKMYSEKLSGRKMPCIVLRPSNIYGPNDKFDPERSHVLPALIRKVVNRQNPLEIWGDGTDVRDFIYVDDIVDACILAMERINKYLPMNVGMGKTYTVNEILKIICRLDGYENVNVVYDPSKPTMIPKRSISVDRVYNILGWKSRIGIEEGIRKTIDWYKINYEQK